MGDEELSELQIDGPTIGRLIEALFDAFEQDEFTLLLLTKLDKKIAKFSALNQSFDKVLFQVIGAANRHGWVKNLIVVSIDGRRGNAKLRAIAEDLGLLPVPLQQGAPVPAMTLERLIRDQAQFQDPDLWHEQLGRLESRVCRVEKKMKAFGTGFLVGANLVMTNHHVVEDLLQGRTSPKDFTLRFDFRRDRDGVTVRAGTAVNLHQNWLVHSSPRHSSDTEVNPQSEPSGDQLDFAVIRTEGSPGNNPIQGQRASPDEKRGWITMEVADVAVPAGQTMIILQHPNGQPLQIAFGQALARNRTQTRQRYHVNTEAGSSGSPCFSMDLKLSLLHHAGDPNFDRAAAFNQGIPLAAIRESLRRAGHLSKIGVDEIT